MGPAIPNVTRHNLVGMFEIFVEAVLVVMQFVHDVGDLDRDRPDVETAEIEGPVAGVSGVQAEDLNVN